jgi:hypothetical protein
LLAGFRQEHSQAVHGRHSGNGSGWLFRVGSSRLGQRCGGAGGFHRGSSIKEGII